MSLTGGTAAAGFAAAQRPDKDAPPQNLLQRRELADGEATTAEKVSHVLHSYKRKTTENASPREQRRREKSPDGGRQSGANLLQSFEDPG